MGYLETLRRSIASPASPGGNGSGSIVIPADDWRWEVARWPIARWRHWHHRVAELTPADANAAAVLAAQHRAYLAVRVESMTGPDPTSAEPSPTSEEVETTAEDDTSGWIDDDSMTIPLAELRTALEFHQETRAASERESKSTTRGNNRGAAQKQAKL